MVFWADDIIKIRIFLKNPQLSGGEGNEVIEAQDCVIAMYTLSTKHWASVYETPY